MNVAGCNVVAKHGKHYLTEAEIERRVPEEPEYPGFWWRETKRGPFHVAMLGGPQPGPTRRRWSMEVVGDTLSQVRRALRRFGLTSSIRAAEIKVNPVR